MHGGQADRERISPTRGETPGDVPPLGKDGMMHQDRRNVFTKLGLIGAGALAWAGLPKAARADAGEWPHNPLLGLWELTIPDPGYPTNYYKMAVSEGAYI